MGKREMAKRILIAAPVHQSKEIFKEYLNSLYKLKIPNDYIVDYYFILHNCEELKEFLNKNQYEIINNNINIHKEKNKQKIWNLENFNFLSQMRTKILNLASLKKYDYLFTIDSDILLHPNTLIQLLNDNKNIVGNMIWTKMDNQITAICGKNEEWGPYENTDFLKQKGLYQIGWTCACLLINSKIFNNPNISYYPIYGVDNTGCEDYAFCLRIKCNFPEEDIWIDTHYPARHLYHEKDYERWMKEKKQYE